MKELLKKILRKLHILGITYKCYIWILQSLRILPWNRKRHFYKMFDRFISQVEQIAPLYKDGTVVFFGRMANRRKAFLPDLARRLEERYPNRRILFVNRGALGNIEGSGSVKALFRKIGMITLEEWRSGTEDWASKRLKLELTAEIREAVREKPYLQQAVAIAKAALGNQALPNYAEVLVYENYRCFKELLDHINVISVNIWNKFRFNHYLFDEMCRERGIPVTYLEFGSLPGSLVFDRNGQMGESWPAVSFEEFRTLAVTEDELQSAESLVQFLRESGLNRRKQPENNVDMDELARLKPGRPIILFAGQWDSDSGLVPYTENTKRYHSPIYKSTLDALCSVAQIAQKHDWNLVFKPHPSVLFEYKRSDYPSNVITVGMCNLNEIIDRADVVVTILSSTAYISLIRERPCVMLGYNQIRGKGCTYEAFSQERVEPVLCDAVEKGYTNEQRKAFIRHVAQMRRYYLYDDGQKAKPYVCGRPIDMLSECFEPYFAETTEGER